MEDKLYKEFSSILHNELIVSMGCTEPGCIAFCAATMREYLGHMPERIVVKCSRNVLKNVKGAVVPFSNGHKGVDFAATLGTIGGDPRKKLEALSSVNEEDLNIALSLLQTRFCQVELLETPHILHVVVTGFSSGHSATVELLHTHTGIARIVVDDVELFRSAPSEKVNRDQDITYENLTVERIVEFAQTVDLDEYDLKSLINKQIEYNSDIAREGLSTKYGTSVGSTLIHHYGNNVVNRAKAYAAAGSDARMAGCNMPVVINSGSGNQGLSASLPVIVYANELYRSKNELIRALLISNLVALRIKSCIGRLSAFCGAVSAATGSGAAISWLHCGSLEQINMTIINSLANISGMVCDGAKPSCAAKIASAVDNAIMAHYLSMDNKSFKAGDGLVKHDVESTIDSICRMAREGMIETDRKIADLMMESLNSTPKDG